MATFSLQLDEHTLVLDCDPRLESQANWLLRTLTQFNHRGKGLTNGTAIQVGWSLLSIHQHDHRLVVHEPDYSTNPFTNTRADVTHTLVVLAQQRDLIVRTNTAEQGAVIPRFDDKIVLRKECLATPHIYLDRRQPKSGDSGWYIGPVDETEASVTPDGYESIFVYQLLELRPALLSVLGLPSGYMVIFAGETIETIYNEQGEPLSNL